LTDREVRLLRSPEEMNKITPSQKRTLFRDLRRKAKGLLDALANLAEYLPEKQQEQIFTVEALTPLVGKLLGWELKNRRTDRHYQLARQCFDYGLNICQERIHRNNRDAWPLTTHAFNDIRQMIWTSIPLPDKRKQVKVECPKCKYEFETRDSVVRCQKCGEKFKVGS